MKRRIPIEYQGIAENGAVCTGDLFYKRNGAPCIRFWTENGCAFHRIEPESLEMVAVKIKPIINFEGVASCGECPNCGAMVETDYEINYCFNCGQRIDWSDFQEGKMNDKREYVIVCNEHKGLFRGCLLFWGYRTEDKENRCFGGYTSNLDECERYTLEEIRGHGINFPVSHAEKEHDFRSIPDVIVKVSDLINADWLRSATVIYRP